MSNGVKEFESLEEIADELRSTEKKVTLLFAHNGVGKTRLSMEFRSKGRNENAEEEENKRDTLYFNAFTEDLFSWDNDLDTDTNRILRLNIQSKFFKGLDDLDIANQIRPLLERYANFSFDMDTAVIEEPFPHWQVSFSRDEIIDGRSEEIPNIKISRGEENIFIWCFFLAVMEIALDTEIDSYNWVKYIYIDDPISSLDDSNVITVASHLSKILKENEGKKVIVSTHHGLFYNVMYNALKKAQKYLLTKDNLNNKYSLKQLKSDTPFYQHIGILKELHKVSKSGNIYKYHFNLLRNILEKTAAFHGLDKFSDCISDNTGDVAVHTRRINIFSHSNYSIFDPEEMDATEKDDFINIIENFIDEYHFNDNLFLEESQEEE